MHTNHQSKLQTIIKAPVEKVWDALINPEIVKQYFFGSDQKTDWNIGSKIQWSGEYEGTPYLDKGVVLEFVPHERLSYSYLSSFSGLEDKPENYLKVSYEVRPAENGTELTITQANYDEERANHSRELWSVVVDGMKKIVE